MTDPVWQPHYPTGIKLDTGSVFDLVPSDNIQLTIFTPGALVLRGNISPSSKEHRVMVADFDTPRSKVATVFNNGSYMVNVESFINPIVICFQNPGIKFTPNKALNIGDIVRPSLFQGVVFEIVEPGVSGSLEPVWWFPDFPDDYIGTAKAKAKAYSNPLVHGPIGG